MITNIDRDHLDTYRDLDDDPTTPSSSFADRVPFFGQVIALPRRPQRPGPPAAAGRSPGVDLRLLAAGRLSRRTTLELDGARSAATLPGSPAHAPSGRRARARSSCRCPGATTCATRWPRSAVGLGARPRRSRRWRGARRLRRRAPPLRAARHLARRHGGRRLRAPSDRGHGDARRRRARSSRTARVHAVFQPHLYSRTRDLADEFGRALLGRRPRRSSPTSTRRARRRSTGVTGELVVEAARASGHRNVDYCADWREAPGAARRRAVQRGRRRAHARRRRRLPAGAQRWRRRRRR